MCIRDSYEGVQTYMDMKDGSLIAVQPNKDDLMSQILSPDNLNRAYLQAVSYTHLKVVYTQ